MKLRKSMILLAGLIALVSLDFVIWSQEPTRRTDWCEFAAWSYDTAKTSTVSIVRSDNPDLENPAPLTDSLSDGQIQAMVDKAIELAGGLEGRIPADARLIVIKPNIVEPVANGLGVNTDARVVRALVLHLYRLNPEYEIKVAEAAGGWARPGTPHVAEWAYKRDGVEFDGYEVSGYRQMIDSLRNDPSLPDLDLEWVDLNYDDTVAVKVPEPRITTNQEVFYLPRTMVEADFVINAPVLKVHTPCVTVGLKNWVGILPGMVYGWSHDGGYNNNGIGLDHSAAYLQKDIVELYRTLPADFVVVDAVVGKEVTKGFYGKSRRRNMIVAGDDVVGVDAVCSRLMDYNPDDVEHITLAHLVGLGQIDLEKITVVGSTIEECASPFIKAKKIMDSDAMRNASFTYYGQSNRTWLLRGGFPGTDLDTDHLGGEAGAAPRPGVDGWSVPVYFHDDLIDPPAFLDPDALNCTDYAFTWVDVPDSCRASLWIGSSGAVAVWLNGERVYGYDGMPRTHRLPNDVVDVDLPAGTSRILVKTVRRLGVGDFSLNVCELDRRKDYAGNRLAGAKFLSDDPGRGPRGDFNGDGKLDVFDLLELLRALGEQSRDSRYDLNSDSRVDVFDLLDLLRLLAAR